MFTPRFWFPDKPSSGVALFGNTAPGHRLSEQLLRHVYVYWLTHSVELLSKEIAHCSQKRQHPAIVSEQNQNSYWYQNKYKMGHFTKEIMMLVGDSLVVMWFPLWFCLFNMHFPVQSTCCQWPEGIQSERSFLAIMCCLLYQKIQSRCKLLFFIHLELKPEKVMWAVFLFQIINHWFRFMNYLCGFFFCIV